MLEWKDSRWHCDGKPIHAGSGMEMKGFDGEWFPVRIESRNCGRALDVYVDVHGRDFSYNLVEDQEDAVFVNDVLRWPAKEPESRLCRDCDGEGFIHGDGFSEDSKTCGSCGGRGCVPV